MIQDAVAYLKEKTQQMAEDMIEQRFIWSEYSSDASDRGVEVVVTWRGQSIPIRIKRALTIDERQKANRAAIQIDLDKDGKPTITRQDQSAYTKMICLVGLKYWPFEYSPGQPVPINMKTLSEMDGSLLDEISLRILSGTQPPTKAQLDPLESPSEEAS